MKKHLLALIPLLVCSSCGPAKLNIEAKSSNTSIIMLSEESLKESVESKEDKLIYLYLSTCLTCATVESYLNTYIENTGATIYKMLGPTFPYELFSNLDPLPFYPALLFIKSGEVQTVKTQEITNEESLNYLLNKRLNLINTN